MQNEGYLKYLSGFIYLCQGLILFNVIIGWKVDGETRGNRCEAPTIN